MAWDKVTKIDTIAKRKAWSKVNEGVLTEHRDAYGRVSTATAALTNEELAKRLGVRITKRGRIVRVGTTHGNGSIVTNFAQLSSARSR